MPEVIAQVTLKNGGEYHPPGSVVAIDSQEEADDLVDRGFAEWAGEEEQGETEEDSDLPFTPSDVKVAELADRLAEVNDVEVVEALAGADDRSTAGEHYEARIAELEEEQGETEE